MEKNEKNNYKFWNIIVQILIYSPLYIYIFHKNLTLPIINKIAKYPDLIFILIYSIWGATIYKLKTNYINYIKNRNRVD